jgi:hypothetical protein
LYRPNAVRKRRNVESSRPCWPSTWPAGARRTSLRVMYVLSLYGQHYVTVVVLAAAAAGRGGARACSANVRVRCLAAGSCTHRNALERLPGDQSTRVRMCVSLLDPAWDDATGGRRWPPANALRPHACRTSRNALANEIIGIDLGTTNSCVSVMEGKVRRRGLVLACRAFLGCIQG